MENNRNIHTASEVLNRAAPQPAVPLVVDSTLSQFSRLHDRLGDLEARLDHYMAPSRPKAGDSDSVAGKEGAASGFHERMLSIRSSTMSAADRVDEMLDRLTI